MKFHLTLGDWAAQHLIAQKIRHEVFVIEQNVPIELEWDEMDAVCLHAIAYDDQDRPIATGRLLPDGHIGRMAVLKSARNAGIGAAVLDALMQEAQKRGDSMVQLNAQVQAQVFYARHGFVRDGEEFIEADIPHIRMQYVFPQNAG